MTALSPLTVFVAIAGLKTGLLPIDTAYDVITMQAGLYLAGLGVLGALISVVAGALSLRRSWLIAVVAAVMSATTVTLFLREVRTYGDGITNKMDPDYRPGAGVSTDPVDQIGFSPVVMAERRRDAADTLIADVGPNGCEIAAVPSQSAPGVAGYALQKAGFAIRDIAVNRANGVHTSVWFDRTYDAAIRIRPGRTDVRVAPRDGAHDHGTSCRLAARILAELQPGR